MTIRWLLLILGSLGQGQGHMCRSTFLFCFVLILYNTKYALCHPPVCLQPAYFNHPSQEWSMPTLVEHAAVTLAWLHKITARANNRKTMSSFHRLNYGSDFTGVISTNPSSACCWHVPLVCRKCWPDCNQTSQEWLVPTLVVHAAGTFCLAAQNGRQSKNRKNLVQISQVKLLARFQLNCIEMISTNPSYACQRHILLGSSKWPPELTIEQDDGPISLRFNSISKLTN